MKRPDRKRGTRYRLARWLVPIAALAMTVASSLSAIVPVKRLRILTPCAVLIFLALLPSAASAKAMSFWFSEQHTEVFTDTVSCAGGLTGIATLTETSTIHVVQRSNGSFSFNGVADFETKESMMARVDEFGTLTAYNHYAVSWAHAMCMPYQWTK